MSSGMSSSSAARRRHRWRWPSRPFNSRKVRVSDRERAGGLFHLARLHRAGGELGDDRLDGGQHAGDRGCAGAARSRRGRARSALAAAGRHAAASPDGAPGAAAVAASNGPAGGASVSVGAALWKNGTAYAARRSAARRRAFARDRRAPPRPAPAPHAVAQRAGRDAVLGADVLDRPLGVLVVVADLRPGFAGRFAVAWWSFLTVRRSANAPTRRAQMLAGAAGFAAKSGCGECVFASGAASRCQGIYSARSTIGLRT